MIQDFNRGDGVCEMYPLEQDPGFSIEGVRPVKCVL